MKNTLLVASFMMLAACASQPKGFKPDPETAAKSAKVESPCKKAVDKWLLDNKVQRSETVSHQSLARPKYPADERQKGITGCTGVIFDIDSQGLADNFRVVAVEPKSDGFKEETLKALMRTKFEAKNIKNHSVVLAFMLTDSKN